MTDYAFRDTELAARRLALVSEVFASATRAFVEASVTARPQVLIDLGCGPGYSTELLADATRAERIIGLDISEAYVAAANARGRTSIEYLRHDVTELPLPGAPADVVYCRLLLAHLPHVVDTVLRWVTQVRPGGLLMLDEVECIDTGHPVLDFYEAVVVGLVAAKGGPMYAGPVLATLSNGDGWAVRSSEVRVVPVATAAAARMYGMNLAVWRDDPWVLEHHGRDAIDRLAADLDALGSSPATGEITWGLRQVTIARH